MAKADNAAVRLIFESLPIATRRKLNYSDLESVEGGLSVHNEIRRTMSENAARVTALQRFKRQHGYCGGEPTCQTFVGKGEKVVMCGPCRALFAERRKTLREQGPSKRRVTLYGRMRAKEREQERAERERQGR